MKQLLSKSIDDEPACIVVNRREHVILTAEFTSGRLVLVSPKPGKSGRPEEYPFAVFERFVPEHSEPGLPLNQLATRLSIARPITAKQLYNVVQRWIDHAYVEVIDTPGQPKLYRKTEVLNVD